MLQARLGVLALLACLAVAGLFAGQDRPPPLPRHFEQLGLREDQARAIRKAQASYRAKIAALRKKIDAIRDRERKDTQKVLAAAQLKLLRDYQAGRGPKDK